MTEYTFTPSTVADKTVVKLWHSEGTVLESGDIILSADAEPKESSNGTLNYQFSNRATSTFCSISAEDKDRLAVVRVSAKTGRLLLKATVIADPDSKEFNQSKPFMA
jgi:hypothetical protein